MSPTRAPKQTTHRGTGFLARGHDHRRCVDAALSRAEDLCAARSVRLTGLRRRVLELIWGSHKPLGAYQILEALRGERPGAAPPTVYRAVEFLVAQGLVHRIESLNAFVGCAHPGESHVSQLLICRACGEAAEIADPRLADTMDRITADAGFLAHRHAVEAVGLCRRCQIGADPE